MLSTLTVFVAVFGSLHGAGILLDSALPDMNNMNGQQHMFQKPAFCHDLECPRYMVLEKNDKFEVRKYEKSVWVATEIVTMTYTKQQNSGMFFKLFHYISGNNTMDMKIAMTAPVITEVLHGPGPDCESNFTMHFMVPFSLQANPPQPTEAGVFIRTVPEMTVYVRSYGGYSTDDTKRENIEMLTNDLMAANKPFRDDVFYTAGYDGPYAFVRHNEIWMVAM